MSGPKVEKERMKKNQENSLSNDVIYYEVFDKGSKKSRKTLLQGLESNNESEHEMLSDFSTFDAKYEELEEILRRFLHHLLQFSSHASEPGVWLDRTNEIYSRITSLYFETLLPTFELHQKYLCIWSDERFQNSYLYLQSMIDTGKGSFPLR